jgi:hypothetical protein
MTHLMNHDFHDSKILFSRTDKEISAKNIFCTRMYTALRRQM